MSPTVAIAMPRRSNTADVRTARAAAGALTVAGASIALRRVFKHDFFAATCLYEAARPTSGARPHRREVRPHPAVLGLAAGLVRPVARRARAAIYGGWPAWRACRDGPGASATTAYAIEYIDARPLDHLDAPPPGFFDRLARIFDADPRPRRGIRRRQQAVQHPGRPTTAGRT